MEKASFSGITLFHGFVSEISPILQDSGIIFCRIFVYSKNFSGPSSRSPLPPPRPVSVCFAQKIPVCPPLFLTVILYTSKQNPPEPLPSPRQGGGIWAGAALEVSHSEIFCRGRALSRPVPRKHGSSRKAGGDRAPPLQGISVIKSAIGHPPRPFHRCVRRKNGVS